MVKNNFILFKKSILIGCLLSFGQYDLLCQSAEGILPETAFEHSMTLETVSPERLKDFDFRAQQKVQDFVDLLNFIGNPEIDMAIRKETIKSALGLFENNNILVQLPPQSSKTSIQDYLKRMLESEQTKHFELLNIKSTPPFAPTQKKTSWAIFFTLKTEFSETFPSTSKYIVSANLEKRGKQFGRETLQVWEVSLGKISIVP